MDDRAQLNGCRGTDTAPQPDGGAVAAWLAAYGMVALLPTEESATNESQRPHLRAEPERVGEPAQVEPHNQAEAAVLIRLSAQKLWAEGRANPVSWVCRSWIGDWQTDDRVTWRTTDGVWLAQLQRSPNGRRVFLYLWHSQTCVGYQDDLGWHPAPTRSRGRQPRPVHRSLPMPLSLAG